MSCFPKACGVWPQPRRAHRSTRSAKGDGSGSSTDSQETENRWLRWEGCISTGGDLLVEVMTLSEAMVKCMSLANCKGFTFHGDPAGHVQVYFKDHWDVIPQAAGWSSYQLVPSAAERIAALERAAALPPPDKDHRTDGAQSTTSTVASDAQKDTEEEIRERQWTCQEGCITAGGDLHLETMSVQAAMATCMAIPGCRGFTFCGNPSEGHVQVFFKNHSEVREAEGWTSYVLVPAAAAAPASRDAAAAVALPERNMAAVMMARSAPQGLRSLGLRPTAASSSTSCLASAATSAAPAAAAGAPGGALPQRRQSRQGLRPIGACGAKSVPGSFAPPAAPKPQQRSYAKFEGFLPTGGDLHHEVTTVEEALRKAVSMPGCKGFTFHGDPAGPVMVYFKDSFELHTGVEGWTSYQVNSLNVN